MRHLRFQKKKKIQLKRLYSVSRVLTLYQNIFAFESVSYDNKVPLASPVSLCLSAFLIRGCLTPQDLFTLMYRMAVTCCAMLQYAYKIS